MLRKKDAHYKFSLYENFQKKKKKNEMIAEFFELSFAGVLKLFFLLYH